LTGRDELIRDELEIFLNYPALGVGPGMSEYYHYKFRVGSHTEYSRLLAEHGLFGLSSILILLVSIWLNLRKEHTNLGKAIVASFSLWSLLFMSSAAMRLVAPAFIFGVGFATILPGERSRFQLVLQRLQQLRKRLTRQRII
jgi:O-antigen ligase